MTRPLPNLLRESLDLSVHNGDAFGLRTLWQSWHAEHITGNGHNHLTTTVQDNITNADGKAFGRTITCRVGRKRILRLGYADRIMTDVLVVSKDRSNRLQLPHASLAELHGSSAIDALTYFLYLAFYRIILRISEVHGQRLYSTDGVCHLLCQVQCSAYGTTSVALWPRSYTPTEVPHFADSSLMAHLQLIIDKLREHKC